MAGVVLAAGKSARMGSPKALLDAGGMTFAARLVNTLGRGGCAPLVVVVASGVGELAAEVRRSPADLVVNPGGQGGQIGSLCVALEALRSLELPPAAVLFTPVDNPLAAPSTVRALIRKWRRSDALVVIPKYGSRRGHPVLADMRIAQEFLEERLAGSARVVIRRDPGRVAEVEVDDPGTVDDLDTRDRYLRRFPRVRAETG